MILVHCSFGLPPVRSTKKAFWSIAVVSKMNIFLFAGMNTGIQDAHNIAWKLFYFLNDIASSSILNTYESERQPV